MNNTLRVIRGDDFNLNLTITDENDDPIDLTGYTLFFTAKKNIADADEDAVLSTSQNTHYAAAAGQTTLSIEDTITDDLVPGDYQWDLQIKYPDGRIHSSYPGILTVVGDVTNRTT